MSILIKGWTKDNWEELIVWARLGTNNCMIGKNTEVIELPLHGRLIDADALRLSHCAECILMGQTCDGKDPDCWSDSIYHIDHASTIIEAEGET